MASFAPEKLAAMAAAGMKDPEIVAILGRRMTAEERQTVNRQRGIDRLKKHTAAVKQEQIDINAQTIDEIMQRDIANVIQKTRTGKPLNNSERALLREIAPETPEQEDAYAKAPKRVKSDAKMKDLIMSHTGCAMQVAYRWLEKLKGMKNAQGWPAKEVLATIDQRRKEASGGANADLKRQKLEEETLILRGKRLREWGQLMTIEEHHSEIDQLCSAFISALENWVQRIAAEKRDADLLQWAEDSRNAITELAQGYINERINGK